nr:7200_t:CDS:2 [Entrophospora candida]
MVSSYHLFYSRKDVIKGWANEVHEVINSKPSSLVGAASSYLTSFSSSGSSYNMPQSTSNTNQYHALGILYLIYDMIEWQYTAKILEEDPKATAVGVSVDDPEMFRWMTMMIRDKTTLYLKLMEDEFGAEKMILLVALEKQLVQYAMQTIRVSSPIISGIVNSSIISTSRDATTPIDQRQVYVQQLERITEITAFGSLFKSSKAIRKVGLDDRLLVEEFVMPAPTLSYYQPRSVYVAFKKVNPEEYPLANFSNTLKLLKNVIQQPENLNNKDLKVNI